jgi:hypothetical protein
MPQLLPAIRAGGVNARHCARDRTAGFCRRLHTEPLRQYRVVHDARCCPDHPVRHGNFADLSQRIEISHTYARGLRWVLSLWHRRRPWPDASPRWGDAGQRVSDVRSFVEKIRSYDGIGALPPIVLAALRKKVVALAAEIGQGVVFANASLSHMPQLLAALPPSKHSDPNFLIGNMLPVGFVR